MISILWSSFLASVVSFTRFPIKRSLSPADFQNAVWHLPLWGVIFTCLQALILVALPWSADGVVSSGLILALPILITGAFHEDGLADFFDGVSAAHERKKRFEIMKDPHLGTYGALALFLCLGLQWAAIWELPHTALIPALLLSQVGARWISLILISSLPYAQQEKSRAGAYLPKPGFSKALLYASLVYVLCFFTLPSLTAALLFLSLSLLLSGLWWLYLHKTFDGYTGDCLGAAIKLSELALLLLANAVWQL